MTKDQLQEMRNVSLLVVGITGLLAMLPTGANLWFVAMMWAAFGAAIVFHYLGHDAGNVS